MALLIAIISIAILTVVATDFAYNSRVDLQLAANQRDEVRAYFLARSGIAMSRLVLKFQRQLDRTPIPGLGGALGGGAAAPGQPGQGGSSLSIQIWRMARVDCHMLRGMVAEPDERDQRSPLRSRKFELDDELPEVARDQQKRSFGGFEGCFNATISDEEEKLNVAKLDAPPLQAQPVAARMLDMFGDKRFEFLFEHEDGNGVKADPQEMLIHLKDWIDEDEVQASLNLSGQGTDVFLKGFTDEGGQYDRYQPRYRPKNASFDSLDELYLVHGVNDRFMAAFKDRLTVYPDNNAKLNVNTQDPMLLYMAILSVADPSRPDPRLANPLFVDQLIKQIKASRMFSFMGSSVSDFTNIVQAAGVPVNQSIRSNVQNNQWVSDKSSTYRISAVGEAGSVQKTVTAVIRLDDALGKLVYWREE